ncbi:hypothetical protein DICPUDRAFT_30635 [Dictyostelium purpureum]|uniref:endopeptidase La n=1 Tax=Dictyostelium purpureum TaxID=5786 RepID=F0ZFT1_DICPU|nr:uncharacterized protein DICPUDRAFT_30635 [Dictyostelium purpureum]EGC37209.1 hypothetical protein DICPUDRAFT_30635 [Dictyostelium purpureum]|eukprot:XP_003286260.1 hypothetical protein DICPUDRAFT_30635 [Dictyostelium purpureum]
MLSLTNKIKSIKGPTSILIKSNVYNRLNNNKNIFNLNSFQNNNKSKICLFNENNGLKQQKLNYCKKNKSNEDNVESLSAELFKFENKSNQRKDWPINNEVLIYPTTLFCFKGATGNLNLMNVYISKLIPNSGGKSFIGVFYAKNQPINQPFNGLGEKSVGALAQITYNGRNYEFETTKRIRIKELHPVQNPNDPQVATIEPFDCDPEEYNDPRVKETVEKINQLVLKIQELYPDIYKGRQVIDFKTQIQTNEDPELYFTSIINYYGLNDPDEFQEILETRSIIKRLEKLYDLIVKEEKSFKKQQEISEESGETASAAQKRIFLLEQLKKTKQLLGHEADEKERAIEKYNSKLASLVHIPEANKKVIQEEISKFSTIDPLSAEYSLSKNYLEWLLNLPWGVFTPEFFDLKYSKDVLDSDHYGLNDIKQRILEFISIGHLKGSVQGKIICFIGPPGTGKTSIAKSIAKCLKKEFYRFSVGGLVDESEIKGHRRTYIGAMPGKIIQAMKLTQTSNPVILIDEIDKIGKRTLGDPSSALLEVLDPEQNSSFVDHYLDTTYDFSKVLFICTANSEKNIPMALFDRMEIIHLTGYVEEEQFQIVKNFIIPKTLIECGIKPDQLTISDEVIKQLVKFYSREVGIRELEKLVEKIMRKTALGIVNGTAEKVELTTENVEEFLGIPSYTSDRYYETTPVGVVNGLAYNTRGGSTLYIESTAEKLVSSLSGPPKEPSLKTTGKLGEVMSESSTIAYTFAKNFLYTLDPKNTFFHTHSIHLHSPQGDQAKEGPSAGVTMATSLLSLALNEPVLNDLGMTGELTITGKVITIGGVKEKTIAAKRSGLKSIIIPTNNQTSFEELPDYIKNGIDVKYAKEYKDVFEIAFPNKKYLLENLKN